MTHDQGYSTTVSTENRQKSRFSDEILPFEMGYLPPRFKRKAEIELHESPENIEKGIRLLREMAKRDKTFDGQTFDDDALLQFLRGKKYDIAKAFARFKAFVNLRRNTLEAFTNFSFDAMSVATRKDVLTFLPRRCHEGCPILRIELDRWEPEEFPVEEIKRTVVVLMAQSLRDPMTQVNGFKVIFNVKSNPIKHLRFCTPSNLYLMYHGTQDCVPARFKEIHVVNKSLTLSVGYMVMRPFMSQKLKERLIFHSGPETLMDYFSPSVLPVEYGGDLEDTDMTDWLRRVTMPDKLATIGGGPPPIPKRH